MWEEWAGRGEFKQGKFFLRILSTSIQKTAPQPCTIRAAGDAGGLGFYIQLCPPTYLPRTQRKSYAFSLLMIKMCLKVKHLKLFSHCKSTGKTHKTYLTHKTRFLGG
jgi:hypothetical protein